MENVCFSIYPLRFKYQRQVCKTYIKRERNLKKNNCYCLKFHRTCYLQIFFHIQDPFKGRFSKMKRIRILNFSNDLLFKFILLMSRN